MNKLTSFIYKLFFILKAAANGWIVKTIGNNKFEFYKHKSKKCNTIDKFIHNYSF